MPHRVHTGPDEHPETCKEDTETQIGLLDRVAARISATGTPVRHPKARWDTISDVTDTHPELTAD